MKTNSNNSWMVIVRQFGAALCLLSVLAGCGGGSESATTEPVVASERVIEPVAEAAPSEMSADTLDLASDASGWKFEQSPGVNDFWLEVSITPETGKAIVRVEIVYDGMAGRPMNLTSSGSFGLNEPVLKDTKWIYRAWDDQNGRHDSTPFNLNEAFAADRAFSAPDPQWSFSPSPNNNPTWLHVRVDTDASRISRVEAIVGRQDWLTLAPTAWGSYAFAQAYDVSASLFFRAWDTDGVSHDSIVFTPNAVAPETPAPAPVQAPAVPAPAAPAAAAPALSPQAIVQGFESLPDGTIYDIDQQRTMWDVPWSNHFDQYARISSAQARYGNQSLQIEYPSSAQSSVGAKWLLPPRGEYYLSYWLRFDGDFDFSGRIFSGGKLPGLGLGDLASGGKRPNGTNGFTSRYMWDEMGKAVLYLYHMDQPGNYGEPFEFRDPGGKTMFFEPGKWHRLTQRVKVNTDASANGEIDVWMDNTAVLSLRGLRLVSNNAKIDTLFFSSFHGGNGPDWWPERNVKAYFDEFIASPSKSDVGL